jgi:hypothetical protein
MNIKFTFFILCYFILISCSEKFTEQVSLNPEKIIPPKQMENNFSTKKETVLNSLDELADLERAGSWFQGLALRESSLHEDIGDYAGAVTAVYKELSYAYGAGLIKKEDIETCLNNILRARGEEEINAVISAILLFAQGKWRQASDIITQFFSQYKEPDGFVNWMLLVCALEENNNDRRSVSEYKSIRARYVQFPEYWYRGARVFSGVVSADYAENCINISPEGPFAGECRKIIAVYSGLKTEDSTSVKTKKEIETVISQSINTGDPEYLDILLPLIGLPENPYTVYAIGALRAINSVTAYRDYFNRKALISHGRLAERLLYISRG